MIQAWLVCGRYCAHYMSLLLTNSLSSYGILSTFPSYKRSALNGQCKEHCLCIREKQKNRFLSHPSSMYAASASKKAPFVSKAGRTNIL